MERLGICTSLVHMCNATLLTPLLLTLFAAVAVHVPLHSLCYPRLQSYPRQVTPTFFSDRVPTISPEQSQELVATLTQLGGLNATGYTVPGVWVLPTAVQQLPWLADGLVQGAVVQQLRIAAGDHENMGEWVEEGACCCWKLLLASCAAAVYCAAAAMAAATIALVLYCTVAAFVAPVAAAVTAGAPATARSLIPPIHAVSHAGEFTGAALAWLESGGKADVATLVKELVPAQPALLTIERLPEGGQAPAAAPTSGA